MNACDPRDCACCAISRRFEPWRPWELRLVKFFILIIIIVVGVIIIIIINIMMMIIIVVIIIIIIIIIPRVYTHA